MSAIGGTKRTALVALHVSAYDPKRTCSAQYNRLHFELSEVVTCFQSALIWWRVALERFSDDKAISRLARPIWSMGGQLTARFEFQPVSPPAQWWATLPMNSQAIRTEMARRLIVQCKIARIVETGTYLGTTTEFFAQLAFRS